ncbi:MAG: hypothetical protein SGI72_17035 [Planctomycetota bacterium]|nr:hypothetical protein [Planctomycetota bacterium]
MQAFLARWSERCNPILVKDVRAAFRGRTFKVMLWAVVFIALVVSFGFVAFAGGTHGPPSGVGYFGAVFGCLALAVHGIVPFAALYSLGTERDEYTLELLQLSGMAAWRLVVGKLASVLLQALLVYSAFLPFLMFAFLLRGMPAEAIVASLVASMAACTAQCAAAMALGALPRTRIGRIVVSVIFLIGLLYTSPLIAVLFVGRGGFSPGFMTVGLASFVVVALTAAIGFATFAAVVLAHAEENRSTPIRVATTFVLFVGCVFAALADSIDTATILLLITLLCIAPSMFFITTERERLPRVVAANAPKWAIRISPLTAWLPGSGRGVLYVLIHLALVLFAQAVIGRVVFGHTAALDGHFMRLFATVLVVGVYLLLPSALVSRFAPKPENVALMRFVIVLLIIGSLLLPVLVNVFLAERLLVNWSLVDVPFGFDSVGGVTHRGPWIALHVLSGLAVFANIPRILRARREWREIVEKNRVKGAFDAAPQP